MHTELLTEGGGQETREESGKSTCLHSEIPFQPPITEVFKEDLEINTLIAGPLRSGH